uniref:Uncharacterized protein n=1 Tax=uncultured marine virus TaxID=186617 RepID=A0A0F7L9B1_9VIRU|nr:hypothetical protein [uncultured marine virus]
MRTSTGGRMPSATIWSMSSWSSSASTASRNGSSRYGSRSPGWNPMSRTLSLMSRTSNQRSAGPVQSVRQSRSG